MATSPHPPPRGCGDAPNEQAKDVAEQQAGADPLGCQATVPGGVVEQAALPERQERALGSLAGGQPAYVQERITNAPGGYYSSLVAGDGRLYVASLPGKLTVIKTGGDKPEILHQADFGERILATPAIVGERLYVRTTTKLWAFGK